MTIAAQRYSGLRDDFNVAVTDFKSLRNNEILNAPLNMVKDAMASAKELIGQLTGLQSAVTSEISDILKEATRVTKDVFNTFVDLTKLPEDMIKSLIGDLLPAEFSQAIGAIKSMGKVCRNNALGNALGFGSLSSAKCGDMSVGFGTCSPNQAADIFGKAGMSALNNLINAGKNLIKQILGLANLGYNANLCNVFASVTQGITNNSVLTTAAGVLLNQQGSKGNLGAVFDLTKSVAAKSLNITSMFPKTAEVITAGIIGLGGNTKNAAKSVGESFLGSLDEINPLWDKTSDGMGDVSCIAPNKYVRQFMEDKNTGLTWVVGSENDPAMMSADRAASAVYVTID